MQLFCSAIRSWVIHVIADQGGRACLSERTSNIVSTLATLNGPSIIASGRPYAATVNDESSVSVRSMLLPYAVCTTILP